MEDGHGRGTQVELHSNPQRGRSEDKPLSGNRMEAEKSQFLCPRALSPLLSSPLRWYSPQDYHRKSIRPPQFPWSPLPSICRRDAKCSAKPHTGSHRSTDITLLTQYSPSTRTKPRRNAATTKDTHRSQAVAVGKLIAVACKLPPHTTHKQYYFVSNTTTAGRKLHWQEQGWVSGGMAWASTRLAGWGALGW